MAADSYYGNAYAREDKNVTGITTLDEEVYRQVGEQSPRAAYVTFGPAADVRYTRDGTDPDTTASSEVGDAWAIEAGPLVLIGVGAIQQFKAAGTGRMHVTYFR